MKKSLSQVFKFNSLKDGHKKFNELLKKIIMTT